MVIKRSFVFLVGGPFLLSMAAIVAVRAQEKADTFTDLVDVRVISVEVVVTDKNGAPVAGLGVEDFQLFADGKPLALTNFYAVGKAGAVEPADESAVKPDGTSPSPALPQDATQALTAVILVDNSSIRPENRKALFERLRRYLSEHQNTEARFMVATMGQGIKVEEPFTDDQDRVLAALQRIERQATLHAALDGERRMFMSRLGHASLRRYQPRQGQESDPEFDDAVRVALDHSVTVRTLAERRYQTVNASYQNLAHLCAALAGLPGRKALIYLSDGLPLRPADSLVEAWTGKYQNWVIQNDDDIRLRSRFPRASADFQRLMISLGSSEFDLQNQLNRLVSSASAAKVAFYPISAGGRNAARSSAEVSGSSMHGDVGGGGMHRNATTVENFTRDATLLRMAEDTGGTALLRSTNLDGFMDRMQRDFTSYYSLGFTPPNQEQDGRFRELTVTVGNGQFTVRHPKGYVAKSWRQELGERTAAAAVFGLESNPLDVRLEPGEESREGDRFLVPIMIKIPVGKIQLVHRDQHFNAQLTVLVLVSDSDGGLSQTHRVDLPIKIPDTRILETMGQLAAYPIELRMKEGRKRIAVGVRDHISGTESALSLEIEVGRGVHL